jgi:hypothetical protein
MRARETPRVQAAARIARLDLGRSRAAVTAAREEAIAALLRAAGAVSRAEPAGNARARRVLFSHTHPPSSLAAGLEQENDPEYDHEAEMEEEEEQKLLSLGVVRDSHEWEDHMLIYRANRQAESERNAGVEQ